MSPVPPIQRTQPGSEIPYPYHDGTFPQKTNADRFGHRTLPPLQPSIKRSSGPNQNPFERSLYPYQWHENPPSKPSRVYHGQPMSQQDPGSQLRQPAIISLESNGRPPGLSRAQPRPSEPLPTPCKSDGGSSQDSSTSTQARETGGANGSLNIQNQDKATTSKEKHKRTEKKRRDGDKELFDKVPGVLRETLGIDMDNSKSKNFVTKSTKLKTLIDGLQSLNVRAKQSEYEKQKLSRELRISDAKAKQLEDEVQKLLRELRVSDAKAKQLEHKAQRFRRNFESVRWHMQSINSDSAVESESDSCNIDQTDYETLCGSHDSDFGGSIRQSHSDD